MAAEKFRALHRIQCRGSRAPDGWIKEPDVEALFASVKDVQGQS